eukprot:SM000108S14216  [mRNA]  locus=s108:216794:218260:- [translate_table: standard]
MTYLSYANACAAHLRAWPHAKPCTTSYPSGPTARPRSLVSSFLESNELLAALAPIQPIVTDKRRVSSRLMVEAVGMLCSPTLRYFKEVHTGQL